MEQSPTKRRTAVPPKAPPSHLRKTPKRPDLSVEQILKWADEYFVDHERWPNVNSGRIRPAIDDTWHRIDNALRAGTRGLPRNSGLTLARLLEKHRGVRNSQYPPKLTIDQIITWAKAHYRRMGEWPKEESGHVLEAPGETWKAIDMALVKGRRGLTGGSSLARLLALHGLARNIRDLPRLNEKQILAWADAFHQRYSRWPTSTSGEIKDSPDENWHAIDSALRAGSRSLRAGSSLADLLARKRGLRHRDRLPRLSQAKILSWCDAHKQRTGHWPTKTSGPVVDAPEETWLAVDSAMKRARRGLRKRSSLAQLLNQARARRAIGFIPKLSRAKILHWCDLHKLRTGELPKCASGPIADAPGETWSGIDAALRAGSRGLRTSDSLAERRPSPQNNSATIPRLRTSDSLAELLARKRGARNRKSLPRLSASVILRWCDAHNRRTGKWPDRQAGPVADAPGETWMAVDSALREGLRGLPGRSSLAQLLARTGRQRNRADLAPLSDATILTWCDAHLRQTGRWPTKMSGSIPNTNGETWNGVDSALRNGRRSLSGGISLAHLVASNRDTPNQLRSALPGRRLTKRQKSDLVGEFVLFAADAQ